MGTSRRRVRGLLIPILLLSACREQLACRQVVQPCPAYDPDATHIMLPPPLEPGRSCYRGRLMTVNRCTVRATGAAYTRYGEYIRGQVSVDRLVSGNQVVSQVCSNGTGFGPGIRETRGPAPEQTCISEPGIPREYCDDSKDLSRVIVTICDATECYEEVTGRKVACAGSLLPPLEPRCFDAEDREAPCPEDP